jgi:hypothetical protein
MIDWNRPLVMQKHPAGFTVHTYRDEPGVYRDVHGKELPEQVAKKAGFNIDRLRQEAERLKTRAELLSEGDRLALDAEVHEVVEENTHFKLVHIGHQVFVIENADGDRLITPTSEVAARSVFADLTEEDVQDAKPAPTIAFKKSGSPQLGA